MTGRLTRTLPLIALLTVAMTAPAAATVIDGTAGPDVLTGSSGADTIHGFAGADRLYGRGGNDSLYGGRGADRLYGGQQADRLFPGADGKKDVLYGGGGPDRIVARGHDWVYAGQGNDTVTLVHQPSLGFALVHVYCGPGYDRVHSPFGGWLIGGTSGCEKWTD